MKEVEQLEFSHSLGGNVNWHKYFRKVWQFPTKSNMQPPDDRALSFLDIFPRQSKE